LVKALVKESKGLEGIDKELALLADLLKMENALQWKKKALRVLESTEVCCTTLNNIETWTLYLPVFPFSFL